MNTSLNPGLSVFTPTAGHIASPFLAGQVAMPLAPVGMKGFVLVDGGVTHLPNRAFQMPSVIAHARPRMLRDGMGVCGSSKHGDPHRENAGGASQSRRGVGERLMDRLEYGFIKRSLRAFMTKPNYRLMADVMDDLLEYVAKNPQKVRLSHLESVRRHMHGLSGRRQDGVVDLAMLVGSARADLREHCASIVAEMMIRGRKNINMNLRIVVEDGMRDMAESIFRIISEEARTRGGADLCAAYTLIGIASGETYLSYKDSSGSMTSVMKDYYGRSIAMLAEMIRDEDTFERERFVDYLFDDVQRETLLPAYAEIISVALKEGGYALYSERIAAQYGFGDEGPANK